MNQMMARKNAIMKASVGIDYDCFESGSIAFAYDALMHSAPYSLDEVSHLQQSSGVGGTPLKELKNISRLARSIASKGHGARIFIKDEALNDSGSFKARRASLSC